MPQKSSRARPSASIALAVAFGAAALAKLWTAFDDTGPSEQQFALSPQECNTECQSRQTDCIEDCDGNLRCEHQCVEKGKACVERCVRAPRADAGVAGAAGSAGRGGAGGIGGLGGAGAGGAAGAATP
jgi:hypothetical protein